MPATNLSRLSQEGVFPLNSELGKEFRNFLFALVRSTLPEVPSPRLCEGPSEGLSEGQFGFLH